jgi:hypothetical protein
MGGLRVKKRRRTRPPDRGEPHSNSYLRHYLVVSCSRLEAIFLALGTTTLLVSQF